MGKRRLAGKATGEKPKKRTGWAFWAVAAAAIVLVGGVITYYILHDMEGVATTGQPAPDFTLSLFDGRSVALSDFKGKAVLVNFWGST
jgi:cytochrome oxidase Cu insertion factor (SCO1/SenC/PrrC family)